LGDYYGAGGGQASLGANPGMQAMLDEKLNPFKEAIIGELKQMEADRNEARVRGERLGEQDYELQSRQQIHQIGNVFYNMLKYMYEESKDKKVLEFSNQLKDMIQTRRFDNLMGPKVPFLKDGVLNLLGVAELTPGERH